MTEEQRRERPRDVDEVVVQFHELEVRRGEERLRLRAAEAAGLVWPTGEPLPSVYQRPQLLPCPACLRMRLDCGRQAVALLALPREVAYLRCRACGNTWKLLAK